jgi:hypothetical protein
VLLAGVEELVPVLIGLCACRIQRLQQAAISHAPATAKARVITHRSVAPIPARALTVSATGS